MNEQSLKKSETVCYFTQNLLSVTLGEVKDNMLSYTVTTICNLEELQRWELQVYERSFKGF